MTVPANYGTEYSLGYGVGQANMRHNGWGLDHDDIVYWR